MTAPSTGFCTVRVPHAVVFPFVQLVVVMLVIVSVSCALTDVPSVSPRKPIVDSARSVASAIFVPMQFSTTRCAASLSRAGQGRRTSGGRYEAHVGMSLGHGDKGSA